MARFDDDPWIGTLPRYTPAATIAECTRLRIAGDWRGAVRAAGFEIDIDDATITPAIARALAGLAPDLVRQYIPEQVYAATNWYVPVILSPHPTGDTRLLTEPALAIVGGAGRRATLVVLAPDDVPRWASVQPIWCWQADAVKGRRAAYADWYDHADSLLGPYHGDERMARYLHPLVHAAVHPGKTQPVAEFRWQWSPVRVRCRTVWHDMRIIDGRLDTPAHTDEEIRRELALRSLGGTPCGCATVLYAWRGGRARLPHVLRRQRSNVFRHALYGHTDDVIGALDAGFDITARAGGGGSLLHYLARLDHVRMWPRLKAAGLPINGPDHHGRTPLHVAAMLGHIDAVRLLLDNGADPRATAPDGQTPDQLVEDYTHGEPKNGTNPLVVLLRERRKQKR